MDLDEALKLLHGGVAGLEEWNRRRSDGEQIPSLRGANLRDAYLSGVVLSGAELSVRHNLAVNV